MEDKNQYLKRTKSTLHKEGMRCMVLGTIMLVALFIICTDGQGGVRFFPDELFWLIQRIITLCFIVGAAGYLLSLTIKIEETDR